MNEVKKITWSELSDIFLKHADKVRYVDDRNPIRAVVVFDPVKSKWKKQIGGYTLESRSYEIASSDKYWHGECGGSSIFAYCLDKTSPDHNGIRLDFYLGKWKIDYCYIKTDEKQEKEVA